MSLFSYYCRFFLLISVVLEVTSEVFSQPTTSNRSYVRAQNQPGQWIVLPEVDSDTSTWLAFRKQVNLSQPITEPVVARIAVDSKYWLWINGKMVVREGGLKRGPNPQDTYYDAVDLQPYLQAGKNTVALLLWYFGKDGFSHNSSGRAGLWLNTTPDVGLASDSTWRVRRHPAYGRPGPPHPNYRLPESNVRYDARQALTDWTTADYDDQDWPLAQAVGSPPIAPWNALVRRPIPLWKDYGLKAYENKVSFPYTSSGDTLVMILPYNAQVTPYFRIRASAGDTVDVRTDNYYGGSAYNVRAEYITRRGKQAYEAPGWMNGHTVRYYFPPGVKVLDLQFRETGYATEFAGRFSCDDSFYDTLWQKAARTLYITMRDTYMDCPDRERAQWWGDVVNELGETFYALDTASYALTRKAIYELTDWQRADSTLYAPVPEGNWNDELPMQMLASVGYYGFWHHYLHTGDTALVRRVYPAVKRYLGVWHTRRNGLVVPRQGGWTWGDWGEDKDLLLLYNAWYYLALKGFREMARLVGLPGEAQRADRAMRQLRGAFNEKFWNGRAYRDPRYEGATDDRGQALAVVSGIADSSKYDSLRVVLREERHASPYMEKYVLEALFRMEAPQVALERMKQRFDPMVNSALTTLWEGWSIGPAGYGGGTYNHAWSGGALTCLSQFVAGVAPEAPAYARYHVLPQPGDLHEVHCRVPSVQGTIEVHLRRTPDSLSLQIVSPPNTTARVGIPKQSRPWQEIKVGDQPVWSATAPATTHTDITYLDEDQRYHYFGVAPGRWQFTAH